MSILNIIADLGEQARNTQPNRTSVHAAGWDNVRAPACVGGEIWVRHDAHGRGMASITGSQGRGYTLRMLEPIAPGVSHYRLITPIGSLSEALRIAEGGLP